MKDMNCFVVQLDATILHIQGIINEIAKFLPRNILAGEGKFLANRS